LVDTRVTLGWGRVAVHFDRMRALAKLIQSGRGRIVPKNRRGALYYEGHFYKSAGPVAPNPFMERIAALLDRPISEILDRGIEGIE
jgi:hypothetical protein